MKKKGNNVKRKLSPKKTNVDWEAIEVAYRAGLLSVREIAGRHKISHTAINKKAKKNGWQRDLSAKVKKAVSTKLVSGSVSTSVGEQEVIERAATEAAKVVTSHRKNISRQRKIVNTLLEELETNEEELKLKEKSEIVRNLTNAAAKYIPLERTAWSLDDPVAEDALHGGNNSHREWVVKVVSAKDLDAKD